MLNRSSALRKVAPLVAPFLVISIAGCFTGQVIEDESVKPKQREFLASQSSGETGCSPEDIAITEVSGRWGITVNWVATCEGTRFQCSQAKETAASCTRKGG